MLDEFGSDDPASWIAGFPDHPHRGFETVTIMLDGRVKHADSVGNQGVIEAGRRAMDDGGPRHHPFRDAGAADGPVARLPAVGEPAGQAQDDAPALPGRAGRAHRSVARDGATVRVIAGEAFGTQGAASTLIPVRLLDIAVAAQGGFEIDVPDSHACFIYVYEGRVAPDRAERARVRKGGCWHVLDGTGGVDVVAGEAGAKVLFADAEPIREPVARYGPFVMNTREELTQAFEDYSRGTLDRVTA